MSFCKKGCKIVGFVSTAEYNYDDSRAVLGMNLSVCHDADNESDLTDERIAAWVETLNNHSKNVKMDVLAHLIYEYHKKLRSLALYTFSSDKKQVRANCVESI